MKKLSLFLLVLALLLPCLASCNQAVQETAPQAVVPTQPTAKDIVWNTQSNLHLVYSQSASEPIKSGAERIFNALASRMGLISKLCNDSQSPENAIHIGYTNALSGGEQSSIRTLDYRIFMKDGKLFLHGGSDEAVEKAVEYFIENYIKRGENSITLPADLLVEEKYSYALPDPTLNHLSLEEYRVVIPENHDIFTLYAAQNLVDFVKANSGILLPLAVGTPDRCAEIILGDCSDLSFGDEQYTLFTDGQDVLMDANGYMIGAAVGDLIHNHLLSLSPADLSTEAKVMDYKAQEAKNAILLIGDGMGIEHINAMKQDREIPFYAEALPNHTECTTYSESVTNGASPYTDSAASATALSTGMKTLNSYIGMDANGNSLTNAREYAQRFGANTAVLTTDVLTGATPAAFLAHVTNRNSTSLIEDQIEELLENNEVDYAEGSLGDDLLTRSAQVLHNISMGEEGFFAMIEEGYIDKHSHNNEYASTLNAMERYNELIAYVIEFTLCHPDTILFITADHETGGLTYNAQEDSYLFTTGNHTNANVKLFVLGMDAASFTENTVDNTRIGSFLCDLYR